MRKVIYALSVISALCLVLYSLNFFCNERMIAKMKDNVFDNNEFAWLGFMEPWIEPYNLGNSYLKQKKYDKAGEEYDKAMEYKLPEDKDCDVRVNKALSLVLPIDVDNIDSDNRKHTIKILDAALEVLSDNECAKDDGTGHDEDAQTLYDEIKKFKEELEQQEQEEQQQQQQQQQQQPQQDQSNGDQDQDQNNGDQNDGQENRGDQDKQNDGSKGQDQDQQQADAQEQKDKELKVALGQLQDEANQERSAQLGGDDEVEDFYLYPGDVW